MIFIAVRPILVALVAWVNLAGFVFGQLIDRRTHLAPPMAALNGDNYDKWDEIKCQVTIITPEVRLRTFSYELSRERLEKTPVWDEEKELVPKIPPGFALRLAKHKYDLIQPFGDVSYRTELQLQQYWGKWLWSVIFTPVDVPIRGEAGFPVFVLMDGSVLHPEEKEHPATLPPKANKDTR